MKHLQKPIVNEQVITRESNTKEKKSMKQSQTHKAVATTIAVNNTLVNEWYERIQVSYRKTAVSILETARVVAEAYAALNKNEHKALEQQCGGKSHLSKLKKIGAKYAVLMEHEQQLPSAESTLYKLADFSDDQIEEMAESGVISPFMTAADVGTVRGTPTPPVTANLVSVMVRSDDKVLKQHSSEVLGILSSIEQKVNDLHGLGFAIVRNDVQKPVITVN